MIVSFSNQVLLTIFQSGLVIKLVEHLTLKSNKKPSGSGVLEKRQDLVKTGH